MADTIGRRVAARIPAREQGKVAVAVGMTPDALSRAVNGHRGFSSGELARIAAHLGADLHELITGEPDPHRATLVAQHDHTQRSRPTALAGQVLDDIALAYRQAPPTPRTPWRPPHDAAATRSALGADFVQTFAARIEQRLCVDVVRVAELTSSAALLVEGRPVIAIPAGSWFTENERLARELGHLVLHHHEPAVNESAAEAFARELLLPADLLLSWQWDVSLPELADRVWELGTSAGALGRRLDELAIDCAALRDWQGSTMALLRRHRAPHRLPGDSIAERMSAAAARRFPTALITAHLEQIAHGQTGRATLAWMLGVPPAALEVDEFAQPEMSTDELAAALGLTLVPENSQD